MAVMTRSDAEHAYHNVYDGGPDDPTLDDFTSANDITVIDDPPDAPPPAPPAASAPAVDNATPAPQTPAQVAMQNVGVYNSSGQFVVITIDGNSSELPPGYYNSPAQAAAASGRANVAPTPAPVAIPPRPTRVDSPAYDINGNLVTVSLLGGDYANLAPGYYVTTGQAAVARSAQQSANAPAPITSQQVGAIYSDPSPQTQAAIQEVFDAPPPASSYVAPTPPVTQGFTPTPSAPPPTPQQIVAQSYVNNGYTPPPAAVLDQIVSGAITAPLTTPLTPANANDPDLPGHAIAPSTTPPVAAAPQNSLASNPPTAQTAPQSPANMPQVFDDTAAFTIGNDAQGNPVMQLVDASANLVQWTVAPGGNGYVVKPFYISTPPDINEKRLIGQDADGNPVFQMIDGGKNLLQWTENHGQTGFVTQPFYVSVGTATNIATSNLPPPAAQPSNAVPQNPGTTTPRPAVNLNPPLPVTPPTAAQTTTRDLSLPQIQVGTTSAGWPIYQVMDSAGVVKQWIINPGPPSAIVDLVNAPTYGTLAHDSVTDAAVANKGGGIVTTQVPATGGNSKLLLAVGAALLLWAALK